VELMLALSDKPMNLILFNGNLTYGTLGNISSRGRGKRSAIFNLLQAETRRGWPTGLEASVQYLLKLLATVHVCCIIQPYEFNLW
jgi:hypothetical protein